MKDISYIDKIVKQHRANLHKIAELSHVEFKTAKYIRDYLEKLGIEYETLLETATVGIIKGKNPKKTIAFRADIDALPTEDGAQHLCGHDGHMSILLGFKRQYCFRIPTSRRRHRWSRATYENWYI